MAKFAYNGNTTSVYSDEDACIENTLKPATYVVRFNQMKGAFELHSIDSFSTLW